MYILWAGASEVPYSQGRIVCCVFSLMGGIRWARLRRHVPQPLPQLPRPSAYARHHLDLINTRFYATLSKEKRPCLCLFLITIAERITHPQNTVASIGNFSCTFLALFVNLRASTSPSTALRLRDPAGRCTGMGGE